MAEDNGKKDEEKLDFTPEGEALGYIGLDQARVLVLQHARDNRDPYGPYADRDLIWEVTRADETEDYYEVTLSYRPASGFRGRPGVEQFTIDKTGPIEFRQILSQPRSTFWLAAGATLAGFLVLSGAAVGGLFASGVLPPSSSDELDDAGLPALGALPPSPAEELVDSAIVPATSVGSSR